MAPAGHLIAAKNKATKLLDFVATLKSNLDETKPNLSSTLVADVDHYLYTAQAFKRHHAALDRKTAQALERQGKSLWNVCVRADRTRDAVYDGAASTYCKIRLLSYFYVDIGVSYSQNEAKSYHQLMYLLQLVMYISKAALSGGNIDIARNALEITAEHVQSLLAMQESQTTEVKSQIYALHIEYLTLRIALSWKEDRLGVADHLLSKAEALCRTLSSHIGPLVDVLHRIAISLTPTNNDQAIRWHEKAHSLLLHQPSTDKIDSQRQQMVAVCQTFIPCLLKSSQSQHLQQASSLVVNIEAEIGEKSFILHWKLELLSKSGPEMSANECLDILKRLVALNDGSKEVFNCTVHHIRVLFKQADGEAAMFLDDFITTKIMYFENPELMSEALLQRIWILSQKAEPDFTAVVRLLDTVRSEGYSVEADNSSIIRAIIWEKVHSLYTNKQYTAVTAWCRIACHPIYQTSNGCDDARFGRKIMLCAIDSGNPEAAVQAFHDMSDHAQRQTLSQYLLFRAALGSWNQESARQSLSMIAAGPNKDEVRAMLYACVREAQEVGDKLCTVTALKAIAQDASNGPDTPLNLPIIIRCAIRLTNMLESSLSEAVGSDGQVADDICDLFEMATRHAKSSNEAFNDQELYWFCKNAYNMGVTKCETCELPYVVRIFSCCVVFCMLSMNRATDASDQLELKSIACRSEFVLGAAHVSMAREEEDVVRKRQCYENVNKHALAFNQYFDNGTASHNMTLTHDLAPKLGLLSVFNFEALVFLEKWNELSQIVRQASNCKDETKYMAMMDCLLRSRAKEKVIYNVCCMILDEIVSINTFDRGCVAKYLRHVFQIILPIDDTLALEMVDRAISINAKADANQSPCTGDAVELEWLVASSFNHSIDLYTRRQQTSSHEWAMKALQLAGLVPHGEALVHTLQAKLAKLQFQDKRN